MLNILPIKLKRKSRKYPIKRDEYGTSARQRAFEAFDHGKRPAEVAPMVEVSLRTACRYFADWKKQPNNLELRYRITKTAMKNVSGFSEQTIKILATGLSMSEEEVISRLQKPWGLKQLLMGKWPNYRRERVQSEQESRLRAALNLINYIESCGMPLKEIEKEIDKLIGEARKRKAD